MVKVKIRAKQGCSQRGYLRGDVFDADVEGGLYKFLDNEGDWRLRPIEEFDIVDVQSPIGTVMRKEIVPGKYGIVTIKECGFIHINAMGTPEKLREAAHILNQIAEVMEDETTN